VSLNKAFIALPEKTTGTKGKVIKQGSWLDKRYVKGLLRSWGRLA
jgi:hypothetical protein